MASSTDLAALRAWLTANGGHLSSDVVIDHNAASGVHCRAKTGVTSGTLLCAVPHALALSSLNALVDDEFTAFRSRGIVVEAIGHFYLMYQFITKERSFWKPYLETLPSPEHEFSTPFWFDDGDLAWLADTDVYHTTLARKAIHQRNFDKGLEVLGRAGVDTAPFTWRLYQWAVTIFTSRAFSSQALRPQNSKYWTAYKTGPNGRRQTVLMDMSRASAEDLDFPVLFPAIDIPNHHFDAKMDWAYDSGFFRISLVNDAPAGVEIYNTYGPKGNDELLLGYGFCLAGNPFDKVLLTLKPAPEVLQVDLRRVHPGYFRSDGAWNSEKATFGLQRLPSYSDDPSSMLRQLPEPLLELLIYVMRHERNLPFEFIKDPLRYLTAIESTGRRYQPHLCRALVQSLIPKLTKIQASTPATEPSRYKQQQAKLYRDGQLEILHSVLTACKSFLRTEFRTQLTAETCEKGRLMTLEELLVIAGSSSRQGQAQKFLHGIAVNAGTDEVDQLRQAGWEEDILVLLLCWLHLDGWAESMPPEYIAKAAVSPSDSELAQAQDLLQIVRNAAQNFPDSLWTDKRWSTQFIACHGGAILQHESFVMSLPNETASEETPRLVVYLSLLTQTM